MVDKPAFIEDTSKHTESKGSTTPPAEKKELDLTQRIAEAIGKTSPASSEKFNSFPFDEQVDLGELPTHLRPLYALYVEMGEKMQETFKLLHEQADEYNLLSRLISISVHAHLPKGAEEMKSFTVGPNWSLVGTPEDMDIVDDPATRFLNGSPGL